MIETQTMTMVVRLCSVALTLFLAAIHQELVNGTILMGSHLNLMLGVQHFVETVVQV